MTRQSRGLAIRAGVIAALCALLGVSRPSELTTTDLLVRGRLGEFCRLREIDLPALSQRSSRRP